MSKIRAFLPFMCLLLISFVAIFYRIDQIPKHLAYDELYLTRLALSLKNHPYIPFSSYADGHGTMYFYIILFSFNLFGLTQFALRLPNLIFGVFNIILFYFILYKIWPKQKMLVWGLSIILLINHWYLNFIRFSFEPPFLLFLELSSIYFLFCFIEKKSWITLTLSAVLTGFVFHSYQPGRIFFLLPLGILTFSQYYRQLIVYIILMFIVMLPILPYITIYSSQDIRINQELFLKRSDYSPVKKLQLVSENVNRDVLMFFGHGDLNGRHNYPGKSALNPILLVFFLIGLGISLYTRGIYNLFFLSWFVVSFIPTFFTYPVENPNMLRTFTTLPSIIYFIGVAIIWLENRIKKEWRRPFIYIICFLMLLSCIYELRTYFIFQSRVLLSAFIIKDDLKAAILSIPAPH